MPVSAVVHPFGIGAKLFAIGIGVGVGVDVGVGVIVEFVEVVGVGVGVIVVFCAGVDNPLGFIMMFIPPNWAYPPSLAPYTSLQTCSHGIIIVGFTYCPAGKPLHGYSSPSDW